jgi:hypothetical protein
MYEEWNGKVIVRLRLCVSDGFCSDLSKYAGSLIDVDVPSSRKFQAYAATTSNEAIPKIRYCFANEVGEHGAWLIFDLESSCCRIR